MEKAELIQDKQRPKMKVFIIDDSKNYYIENKVEYGFSNMAFKKATEEGELLFKNSR